MSSRESYTSVINRKAAAKQQLMNVAMGRERADLVLKNAVYVNVFTNELSQGDIAVKNGVIAGIGHYDGVEELDMQGKIVAPGLIDAAYPSGKQSGGSVRVCQGCFASWHCNGDHGST